MTVSVVVACHNYGRYLRECLESLLAQQCQPTEIVVVDDASTDTTPDIAAAYAEFGVRYERVEYRNACHTFNYGIASTTGDLIAFVDADNALRPEFLQRLVPLLEADPAVGFAYSDRTWLLEGDLKEWEHLGVYPGGTFRSYPPEPAMLVHTNFIDTMAVVRRVAVEQVGGFQDIPTIWDYQLWVAILEAGWQARYCPESLYYYRAHGSNMIIETRPQQRGCRLLIQRRHFRQPFWEPYITPNLALVATILPGQQLPGSTPLHLTLTPQITGQAYPAIVTLKLQLPPGVEVLHSSCSWQSALIDQQGGTVACTIPYPFPDLQAAASSPTVSLTICARQSTAALDLPVTVSWDDCLGRQYQRTEPVTLPAVNMCPPHIQRLQSGSMQVVRGFFAPNEPISVWAALPAEAPLSALTLPSCTANASGVARVDCSLAPQGFTGIVLQGTSAGVQVVLTNNSSPTRLHGIMHAVRQRAAQRLGGARQPDRAPR